MPKNGCIMALGLSLAEAGFSSINTTIDSLGCKAASPSVRRETGASIADVRLDGRSIQ